MKLTKQILLLFSVIILAFSCIMEGEDKDCIDGVRIYISLDVDVDNSGTRALTNSDIQHIAVFAFDSDDLFIGRWDDTFSELPDGYYMELPLDIGEYTFVVWGNLYDTFYTKPSEFTPNKSAFSDVLVSLEHDNGVVKRPPLELYYGAERAVELSNTISDQHITIKINKNTYTINLETEGFEHKGFESQGEHYTLMITDRNGNINFDNTLAHCDGLQYITDCREDNSGELHASLKTLMLNEELLRPDTYIILSDKITGEELFKTNLIDQILELRDVGQIVDFKRTHVYNLKLIFSIDMEMALNINGWEVPIKSDHILDND